MKQLYIIILLLILFFCSGFSAEAVSCQPNVDRLEAVFKSYLRLPEGIFFTKVPRGLIISIDERYFFNHGELRIKESSLCILNTISSILKSLPNYCIVEDHTDDCVCDMNYQENWEVSAVRSANIVEYMIECTNLPSNQLFALGYGESMPFKGNVSNYDAVNNRIDFVILEYEAKR